MRIKGGRERWAAVVDRPRSIASKPIESGVLHGPVWYSHQAFQPIWLAVRLGTWEWLYDSIRRIRP